MIRFLLLQQRLASIITVITLILYTDIVFSSTSSSSSTSIIDQKEEKTNHNNNNVPVGPILQSSNNKEEIVLLSCNTGTTLLDPLVEDCEICNCNESNDDDDDDDDINEEEEDQCTLYMSESTIPGAGLGVFTGNKVYNKDDIVWDGDVMIPIIDLWYHLEIGLGSKLKRQRVDYEYLDPISNYVWYGPELGMHIESAHPTVTDIEYVVGYAPGIDAVINSHPGLINVDKGYPKYDFNNISRYSNNNDNNNYGIGAFTPYYNCPTIATTYIPKYTELYKSYGDDWFIDRQNSLGKKIPLQSDYDNAEVLINLIKIISNNIHNNNAKTDLWDLFINLPLLQDTNIIHTIPKQFNDIDLVINNNNGTLRSIIQKQSMKSYKEFNKKSSNSRCMDNIITKSSTIQQAGRGAFATRLLKHGTIITGTPVLFIPSSYYFHMYTGNWYTKYINHTTNNNNTNNNIQTYQLLYNYCWHHNSSSIYLCPYGNGINSINHNQTLVNVKLQWANDGDMNHNATILLQHPKHLLCKQSIPVHMDLIALRDIQPNEELFLNYGNEYEYALQQHIQQWTKQQQQQQNDDDNKNYISAYEWNIQNPHVMLRTQQEQLIYPYPDHFELRCLPDIDYIYDDKNLMITLMNNSHITLNMWKPDVIGYPCIILQRRKQHNRYYYKVKYRYINNDNVGQQQQQQQQQTSEQDDDELYYESSIWIVREVLKFFDKPYTNNLFINNVFRYPIGIPDDIFPNAWKNITLPPLPIDYTCS